MAKKPKLLLTMDVFAWPKEQICLVHLKLLKHLLNSEFCFRPEKPPMLVVWPLQDWKCHKTHYATIGPQKKLMSVCKKSCRTFTMLVCNTEKKTTDMLTM